MSDTPSFGYWLHQRRRALDLTQQELADRVGCARITLRRIENDAIKPSKALALILFEKLGISEPERARWVDFARGRSPLPSSLPIPPQQPRTNLPAALTSFIGREKEQEDVTKLIRKHRLVTLTGSGGVGKTRLSLKIGERTLIEHPDGIWLAELAPLNESGILPQTVAMIFGVTSKPNIPITEALLNFLREKHALLILDNCEHLLDACAYFADTLLKNCPYMKILATSREALGITGEAVYRVPSLRLPDIQQILEKLFTDCESVRLFEERAQLANTDFALTMDNASSVAQICLRLDGLPLALELASARVNTFSTEQIAAQLKECFQLLTGGSRTALPRQQTIRASIDWSWNLLTESEQRLLRRLSVFAGGWTLEAAQAVYDDNVIDLLNSLVKKSLVMLNQVAGRENRYSFHEIIRQYAVEKLSQSGELETTQRVHADFTEGFLQKVIDVLHGTEQEAWFSKLDEEMDNLRAAVEWTLTQQQPSLAFKAGRLFRYWDARLNYREPMNWVERGLKLEHSSEPAERIQVLMSMAGFLADMGYHIKDNLRRAHEYTEIALGLSQQTGDQSGVAHCLVSLGNIAWREKEIEKAVKFTKEALAANPKPDSWGYATALMNLGSLEIIRSNYEEARAALLRGRDVCARINYEDGVSFMEWKLCILALAEHKLDEAFMHAQNMLNRLVKSFSPTIVRAFRGYMGYIQLLLGNQLEAQKILDDALPACLLNLEETSLLPGEPGDFWFIFDGKARLEITDKRYKRAATLFGVSWAQREEAVLLPTPAERPDYEARIAEIRAGIGDAAFEAAFQKGQEMSVKDALLLASDG